MVLEIYTIENWSVTDITPDELEYWLNPNLTYEDLESKAYSYFLDSFLTYEEAENYLHDQYYPNENRIEVREKDGKNVFNICIYTLIKETVEADSEASIGIDGDGYSKLIATELIELKDFKFEIVKNIEEPLNVFYNYKEALNYLKNLEIDDDDYISLLCDFTEIAYKSKKDGMCLCI